MSEWTPVTDKQIKELPVPATLRIDTRDFYGVVNTSRTWYIQYRTASRNEDKVYSLPEIVETIEKIKQLSGGDVKWRMLDLPGVTDCSGWNMKYINVYRFSENKFLLLTNEGSIIAKSLLSKIDNPLKR